MNPSSPVPWMCATALLLSILAGCFVLAWHHILSGAEVLGIVSVIVGIAGGAFGVHAGVNAGANAAGAPMPPPDQKP